jgi:hypothetical protein
VRRRPSSLPACAVLPGPPPPTIAAKPTTCWASPVLIRWASFVFDSASTLSAVTARRR